MKGQGRGKERVRKGKGKEKERKRKSEGKESGGMMGK